MGVGASLFGCPAVPAAFETALVEQLILLAPYTAERPLLGTVHGRRDSSIQLARGRVSSPYCLALERQLDSLTRNGSESWPLVTWLASWRGCLPHRR